MYPARFRYEAPRTLDEALELLTSDEEAKVLAGGQSLIPMVKLRFASPGLLVDINNITDLAYHRVEQDGTLAIGALCRHVDLEFSTTLGRHPLIAKAAPLVADPIVRNRGTLVGSLCHSDPQGDWATVLLALDGEVVAAGPNGRRTIPVAEFGTGPFQNALAHDEVAVEARIPAPQGTPFARYFKLERRVGDFATAGAAVAIEIANGKVVRAGVALTGVGASNIKVTGAEQALVGNDVSAIAANGAIAEVAELAAAAARPKSDHRGSATYKRHVIRTFVSRALDASLAEAA